MTSTLCPIECFNKDDPDFLSKHSTFVLTLCSLLSGVLGVVLTYFLRSRCKTVKFCCIECDRDVVALNSEQITVAAE